MRFKLEFTDQAKVDLQEFENDNSKLKHLKSVRKCLGLMEQNLRHPSLQTHQIFQYRGPNGEKVFESYPETRTPGAYRIFWYYGKKQGTIIVTSIVKHP